jgi:ribonucleotide monophosphatase NagD (HAD superfamily)
MGLWGIQWMRGYSSFGIDNFGGGCAQKSNFIDSEKELREIIGDTKYDIQMGKSAGCSTCGVTYGNGTKEEIESASPSYIIETFGSLVEIALK